MNICGSWRIIYNNCGTLCNHVRRSWLQKQRPLLNYISYKKIISFTFISEIDFNSSVCQTMMITLRHVLMINYVGLFISICISPSSAQSSALNSFPLIKPTAVVQEAKVLLKPVMV
jgi:hypothetical protein